MPYGEKSAYAAQAALKKKSPAYMKSSGFKMKSPLKNDEKPKLHISEAVSTRVAPVITPVVLETGNGENGGGFATAKMTKLSKQRKLIEKTLPQKLQEKKDRQKKFRKL